MIEPADGFYDVPAFIPERLQLDLFTCMPAVGNTTEERFASFHEQNPHVYRCLRAMAFDDLRHIATRRPRTIKGLYESLRQEYKDAGAAPGKYLLDNRYTSRYARLLMLHEPALRGQFRTRELADKRMKKVPA